MKILFLDDDITRVEEFSENTGLLVTHVKNVRDFISALENGHFDLIMLDHDLGDHIVDPNCGNGCDAAKFLAQNRNLTGDNQRIIVHSANPVGVANMLSHMKHADHLLVSVVWFAWAKATMIDGKLHFRT